MYVSCRNSAKADTQEDEPICGRSMLQGVSYHPRELFRIIEIKRERCPSCDPRRQSERFVKTLLWMITDIDTGKEVMIIADDYDEVLMWVAEDDDFNLLGERSNTSPEFIRRLRSFLRQSSLVAKAMSRPMTEDSTINFSGEPLIEEQGESSHVRRREEPKSNIKNLRPWERYSSSRIGRRYSKAHQRFSVFGLTNTLK